MALPRRGLVRLRRGPSPAPVELQEVVPGADQGPLPPDLGEAPQEELAEAPGPLDEAEDRFRDGLPPGVQRPAALGPELPLHAGPGAEPLRDAAPRGAGAGGRLCCSFPVTR